MSSVLQVAKFITRNFPMITIILSAIAFFYPPLFIIFKPFIIPALGLIMFSMGLTMSLADFHLVFSRPKDVLVGVIARYLLMPLIGYGVATVFHLNPILTSGVILVGCCPSGTSSNVMTFLSKGDAALSVTISSINTLLAPILTPYIFLLFAKSMIPINAESLVIEILRIVILPIALGIFLRNIIPSRVEKTLPYLPAISVILILFILAFVVAANAAHLYTVAIVIFAVVIIHNGLGYFTGYSVGKLFGMDHARSKALSFEIGMENSALAVALAVAHLSPMAAVPAAVYSFIEILSGSILAGYWGRKAMKKNTPNLYMSKLYKVKQNSSKI